MFVKNDKSGIAKRKLCQQLEISESAYYDWLKRSPSKKELVDCAISQNLVSLHQKYPAMGTDMLFQMLKKTFSCGRERIRRLMKQLNIQSVRKKAYKCTTNSKHDNPVSHNLLMRNFKCNAPNEVWVGDITYIPTGEGWLYLAIVKDLFTKKVVGYALSNRIDSQLTINALNMAIRREKPPKGCIFHSDRGVQYASKAYRRLLNKHGFKQSMSRKGDPYDNAVAENFFSCIKCECIHLNYFATRIAAQCEIFRYIEGFYNSIRPHSGINWLSPKAFQASLGVA